MVLVLRVHGISSISQEVQKNVTMDVMVLFVVQLYAVVVYVEHLDCLVVAMASLLVVPLVVLVEMVLDW